MFKKVAARLTKLHFFDDREHLIKGAKEEGCGGSMKEKRVLQDPSLVLKVSSTGTSRQNKDTAAHSQKQEKERAKTIKE